MVNKVILDYLNQYSGIYPLEDLKKNIISTGYSEEEVNEVVDFLGLENDVKNNFLEPDSSSQRAFIKKGFKWIKYSGIIGIVFLIIGILISIISIILPFFLVSFNIHFLTLEKFSSFISNPFFLLTMMLLFLLLPLLLIFFYAGFSKMGRVCESRLLKFSAKAFMVLITIFILLIIISIIFLMIFGQSIANELIINTTPRGGLMVGSAVNIAGVDLGVSGNILIISILASAVLFFMNTILFFIGLIKLGKKIKFAKISGIFGLIWFLLVLSFSIILILNPLLSLALFSSGLGIFFIGSIMISLGSLVLLFLILSLFDASEKFE